MKSIFVILLILAPYSVLATYEDKNLIRTGKFKLVYPVFLFNIDIQYISLYSEKRYLSVEQFINSNDQKSIRVSYLKNLSKSNLVEAWEKTLLPILKEYQKKKYRNDYQKLISLTPSVKKGDEIYLNFKNDEMFFYFNKKLKGRIKNQTFNRAVLKIWLGKNTLLKELKASLIKDLITKSK